jgi:hypothetical protein
MSQALRGYLNHKDLSAIPMVSAHPGRNKQVLGQLVNLERIEDDVGSNTREMWFSQGTMLLRETKLLLEMILLLAIPKTKFSLEITSLPELDVLLEVPLSLGRILRMKIEAVYVATPPGMCGCPVFAEVRNVDEEVIDRSFGACRDYRGE